MLNTRPVSSKSAFGADPSMRSSKMELISAPRCGHDTWILRLATATAGATTPAVFKNKTKLLLNIYSNNFTVSMSVNYKM